MDGTAEIETKLLVEDTDQRSVRMRSGCLEVLGEGNWGTMLEDWWVIHGRCGCMVWIAEMSARAEGRD